VPFFSSEQTDPDRKTAHRARERLSDLAQSLLSEVMRESLELTPARARTLARLCRTACRQLRDFRGKKDARG
jgi:hypothetical protein